MIFGVEHHAVDWLFRYGNQALAELEKMPLEQLLEHSFGTLFRNMDSKWLRAYERATPTVKPLRSLIIARKLIPT